jgi:hypothetical protein
VLLGGNNPYTLDHRGYPGRFGAFTSIEDGLEDAAFRYEADLISKEDRTKNWEGQVLSHTDRG